MFCPRCLLAEALLEVTGTVRINYEILGNSEAALHAHVFPKIVLDNTNNRMIAAAYLVGVNFRETMVGIYVCSHLAGTIIPSKKLPTTGRTFSLTLSSLAHRGKLS